MFSSDSSLRPLARLCRLCGGDKDELTSLADDWVEFLVAQLRYSAPLHTLSGVSLLLPAAIDRMDEEIRRRTPLGDEPQLFTDTSLSPMLQAILTRDARYLLQSFLRLIQTFPLSLSFPFIVVIVHSLSPPFLASSYRPVMLSKRFNPSALGGGVPTWSICSPTPASSILSSFPLVTCDSMIFFF